MKKGLSLLLVILLVLSIAACSTNTEPAESPDASAELDVLTEEVENNQMKLQIGDYIFTATLADNSSAEALTKMLETGPITIEMQDYGSMEKVGSLGTSLPRNDEQIKTEPGDLILYQGNAFVIYYAQNSWNFTRLGKINDVTQEELKESLGNGDVKVVLSLD